MNFQDFIIRDPAVKNGEPIIKGTQITLRIILTHLVFGDTTENILKAYPELTTESIQAIIAFAAAVAQMDVFGYVDNKGMKGKVSSSGLLTDEQVSGLLSELKSPK